MLELSTNRRIELTHVPYRGGAPAMTDLLAGQVHGMFQDTGSSLPHVKSGAHQGARSGDAETASRPSRRCRR